MGHFEAAGQTVRRIWTVVGTVIAIMGIISIEDAFNPGMLTMTIVLAISALVATISIFYLTKLTVETVGLEQQSDKQKNDNRDLQELLAQLDDDRRQRLRDLLAEPPSYSLDDEGELIKRRRK
ncbi:hypothetical protein VZO05_14600 [Aggregatilineales bacterium SYSU G02658]